jgi:predicted dinucleotide-binding enzyme
MNPTIAIIGAVGNMGASIALGLATAGYRVLLTDDIRNHPLRYMKLSWMERRIRSKVPQGEVEMAVSRREASWEADIIIPAVPTAEQAGVASRIKDVVTGKVIISLGSPLNTTHNTLVTAPAIRAPEVLAPLLPHSRIVSVVSPINTPRPGEQHGQGVRTDVLVAGNDQGSVETVMQLVEDAGFHPVFAGTVPMTEHR